MKGSPQADLFALLTSAVGGRALSAMLWISWLLIAVLVHYAQDLARSDSPRPRSLYAFGLIIAAMIFHLVIFLRSLLSQEGRRGLFARRSDLPRVGALVRFSIWVIPILAFGAAVAPAVIR